MTPSREICSSTIIFLMTEFLQYLDYDLVAWFQGRETMSQILYYIDTYMLERDEASQRRALPAQPRRRALWGCIGCWMNGRLACLKETTLLHLQNFNEYKVYFLLCLLIASAITFESSSPRFSSSLTIVMRSSSVFP
jgi:hypothetical protein